MHVPRGTQTNDSEDGAHLRIKHYKPNVRYSKRTYLRVCELVEWIQIHAQRALEQCRGLGDDGYLPTEGVHAHICSRNAVDDDAAVTCLDETKESNQYGTLAGARGTDYSDFCPGSEVERHAIQS